MWRSTIISANLNNDLFLNNYYVHAHVPGSYHCLFANPVEGHIIFRCVITGHALGQPQCPLFCRWLIGLIFSKALFKGLIFGGSYIWSGLSMERNLRLKIDWASLLVGSKFAACFVLLCIWGQFSNYKASGAYILRGDLTEGLLGYRFGGLIFRRAYTWRGLFLECYSTLRIRKILYEKYDFPGR